MGNECCKQHFLEQGEISNSMREDYEPVSFLLEEENIEVQKKEMFFATAIHFKDMDNGVDAPGVVHIPSEGGQLRYIRDLPLIYQDMYTKLEKKFGKWIATKKDRKDDFPVVKSKSPVEIKMQDEVAAKNPLNVYKSKLPTALDVMLSKANVHIGSIGHLDMTETHDEEHETFEFYEGEWRKKKMHGFGKLCTSEGHAYEGNFKAGLPSGRGRILYNNGDYLDGFFEKGYINGYATLYTHDGVTIEGQFSKNTINGEVIETHKDGMIFTGTYENGHKHGIGEINYPNGDRVRGYFINDFLEGKGEFFYKDGRVFKGKFEGNRKSGKGLYTFPDGRQYEGNYQTNFRHGDGILRLKDGSTLKGKWEVGKLNGIVEYNNNGEMEMVTFSKGKLITQDIQIENYKFQVI